jgi:glycosyltransferase involved in cell wall biosynthesis
MGMKKPKLGIIYGAPKKYATSLQISKKVKHFKNFELLEIFQENIGKTFLGKIFILIKQIFFVLNPKFNPDIILSSAPLVASSIPALLAKKIKKIPLVANWDDSFQDLTKHKPNIWDIDYWEYKIILNADLITAGSKNLKRIASILRKSKENIYYIPNGVDLRLFNPDKYDRESIRNKLGIKKDEIVLLYLGHIMWHKGNYLNRDVFMALERLIKKYNNIKIIIIGYGTGIPILKKFVNEKGIAYNFIFLGFLPQHEVAKYISASDICLDVLENTFNLECRSSVKMKEYMAMGKAIIAAQMGENITDLDNGKAGVLLKYNNKEEKIKNFCTVVEALVTNTKLRMSLGGKARKRAKLIYDIRKISRLFENAILKVLHTKL